MIRVKVKKRKRTGFQRRLAYHFGLFARKQASIAVLLAMLSLGGRAVLLHWVPIPKPAIQDEFSYLLAGDTFASGKLTNAKHPLWIHFETVHLIVQPTYQSKYPPVQGLLLALGQVVFGNPWFGIWLSMGALSAALYWALAGWLPPKWALLGGMLALIRVGFFNYWSDSYWGGAAAAAAGALVIGAVPRLRRKFNWPSALILGIGLALLANTRPYEGAVLGAICLGAVLMKVPVRWLAAPLALILIPVAAWMLYYNYRVTGDPLRLPYVEHERQYATSSPFVWQSGVRPAPHYNHVALRNSYIGWDQDSRAKARALPVLMRIYDWLRIAAFILGAPLLLCVFAFLTPILRRQPKARFAILLLFLFIAGVAMEVEVVPHYAAPGTALAFIVAVSALRRLRHSSQFFMRGALAVIVLYYLIALTAPDNRWLFDKRPFIARRDAVLRKLEQSPGKQLVLVDYGKGHDVNQEWVYNRADIDKAGIVWAREMGEERDRELFAYYPDRWVWRLVDHSEGGVDLSGPEKPAERGPAVAKN